MWRERVPDEEYIERLRRALAASRTRRFVIAFAAFLFVAVISWAIYLFVQILAATGPHSPPQQLGAIAAFIAAIVLGCTVGTLLNGALLALAQSREEQRKNQLLVDCWDALHNMAPPAGRAS